MEEPLTSTAKKPRLDTSLDVTEEDADDPTEQGDANAIFGRIQGPAGSEVPDLPAFSAADVNSEDVATTSEATLGIHGPAEPLVADGGEDGADAAMRAAARAKRAGNTEEAVIEALEQAEADYEADHATLPSLMVKVETAMAEQSGSGGPISPRLGRALSASRSGLTLDPVTRDKVRSRMLDALLKNAEAASKERSDLEGIASRCEQCCYASSTSRTVYFSKMGNAARLAAKIPPADLPDLPRIASGEARQVAAGEVTASMTAVTAASGLQGIVMKPT